MNKIFIFLPIIIAAFFIFVPSGERPFSCKLPWATDVCTKYIQEEQLKTLKDISNATKVNKHGGT